MKARILDDGRLRLWAAHDNGAPDPEEWLQLSAWFDCHFAKLERRKVVVEIVSDWTLGSVTLELADPQLGSVKLVEDFRTRIARRRRQLRRESSWFVRLWRRLRGTVLGPDN